MAHREECGVSKDGIDLFGTVGWTSGTPAWVSLSRKSRTRVIRIPIPRLSYALLRKSRIVDLPAGRRTNPRGEVTKPRRVRLIAVDRQLVQSDAVITAHGIAVPVLRETAGDARFRQPLRILAGLFFGNRSYHCIAPTHAPTSLNRRRGQSPVVGAHTTPPTSSFLANFRSADKPPGNHLGLRPRSQMDYCDDL
jgi:hypothetical protein